MKIKIPAMIRSEAAATTDHCSVKAELSSLSVRYSVIMQKIARATRMVASRFSPLYFDRELRNITAAVSRAADKVKGKAKVLNQPF